MKDDLFEQMGHRTGGRGRAPARLKSRVYTAMVRAQQETGPLASVSETKLAGRKLCVFEELVQIAPAGHKAKSRFHCTVCHARVLAEAMENPPIWWPGCPYVMFRRA
jgi:hypothetical protein